jgi:cobalt/nickel transport system permease protein
VASPRLDPRRSRALLLAWLVGSFALSACQDPRILGGAGIAAALLFRRGLGRTLRRVLRSVAPPTALLALASLAWLRLASGTWPDAAPFLALALRASVIALATLSVLERVDLLRAAAPFPALSRLLVVTLAQIHALRLLATESLDGLRSRLPRRPGPLDLLRGAGGITAALFALSARNAREISDAMRSRGF